MVLQHGPDLPVDTANAAPRRGRDKRIRRIPRAKLEAPQLAVHHSLESAHRGDERGVYVHDQHLSGRGPAPDKNDRLRTRNRREDPRLSLQRDALEPDVRGERSTPATGLKILRRGIRGGQLLRRGREQGMAQETPFRETQRACQERYGADATGLRDFYSVHGLQAQREDRLLSHSVAVANECCNWKTSKCNSQHPRGHRRLVHINVILDVLIRNRCPFYASSD